MSTVKTMLTDNADSGEYCIRVRAACVEPVEAVFACRPCTDEEECWSFHNGKWTSNSGGHTIDVISAAAVRWSYTVSIVMKDDTAACLATLCGENARAFFQDCVPADLSQDPASARKLQTKIDAIRTSSCLLVKIAKNGAHFQILQMSIV